MKNCNNHIIKSFMRGFGKTMILLMINKERTHGYEIMKTPQILFNKRHIPQDKTTRSEYNLPNTP